MRYKRINCSKKINIAAHLCTPVLAEGTLMRTRESCRRQAVAVGMGGGGATRNIEVWLCVA